MVDVDSGKIIEFESHEIEELQRKIAADHGYELEEHSLVLYVRKRSRPFRPAASDETPGLPGVFAGSGPFPFQERGRPWRFGRIPLRQQRALTPATEQDLQVHRLGHRPGIPGWRWSPES